MRGIRGTLFLLALCLWAAVPAACGSRKQALEQTETARLGDERIYLEEAVFYTRMIQEQWEEAYGPYYGENLWREKFEGGEDTFAQVLKSDVMETLKRIHLFAAHAEEYGVELTGEEKKTVAERAAAFMEANTPSVLEAAGATEELVEHFLLRNELAAKVDRTVQESCNPEVDPEEARVGKLTYCLFSTMGTYDSEGNLKPFTEEELGKVREEAKRFAERASELGDISAAGEEISHTVIDVYFNDRTDGGAHELVAQAARELSVGGVSGLIETDDGYYVVQRVSEYEEKASEEYLEELRQAARENYSSELLKEWEMQTPLEIEEEIWESIRVDKPLTNL